MGPPDESGERAVFLYVVVLSVVAAGAFAYSAYASTSFVAHADPPTVVLASALFASFVLLQRFGVTFYWRGHRLSTQLDEIAVFLGLMLLPGPAVVLLIPVAAVIVHFWVVRTAIKGAFNVASYAIAAAAGAAAHSALLSYGSVDPLLAAIGGTSAYVLIANVLLAGVFALLGNAGLPRVFFERLAGPTAASAVVGSAGGVTVFALAHVHLLALGALVPFGYLLWRFGVLSAQADRELSVHRSLGAVTHDLVGSSDVTAAAERVLGTCGDLLNCGRVTIVLADARSWSRDFEDQPADFYVGQTLSGAGGVVLGEMRVHPRRGKPTFSELERELLRVVAGQVSSAIENARTLGAFEEARAKLDLYLTTAQDAVLLIGRDGRVDYVNAAGRRLFGLDPEAKAHASDFFDHPVLTGRVRLDGPHLIETQARDRPGTRRFTVEAHTAPIRDGDSGGLLAVVRDVTERKRLEEETVRQHEILVRQEKLSTLGTLVAGVAHEVNNPMTFMKANLELAADDARRILADAASSEDAKALARSTLESMEAASRGIQRIENITSSLKTVARQSQKQGAEDLNAVVRDVLEVLRAGTPKNVKVVADLSGDLPPVQGNAGQLHQVALNLVKNAIEALGEKDGSVSVRTFRDGQSLVLEVADDGPGIPPDVLAKLFEPFHTTKEAGTGLGLSISREIVRAHGGDIAVASAPGEGARFRVVLPQGPGAAPELAN